MKLRSKNNQNLRFWALCRFYTFTNRRPINWRKSKNGDLIIQKNQDLSNADLFILENNINIIREFKF